MRAGQNLILIVALMALPTRAPAGELEVPANRWTKLSPLANTPPSPRLDYEGACVWDSRHHVIIRYGGHNQGGAVSAHYQPGAALEQPSK